MLSRSRSSQKQYSRTPCWWLIMWHAFFFIILSRRSYTPDSSLIKDEYVEVYLLSIIINNILFICFVLFSACNAADKHCKTGFLNPDDCSCSCCADGYITYTDVKFKGECSGKHLCEEGHFCTGNSRARML